MAPSPPTTPPPDVQNAEHHLKQVLSLGEAQPYVIKIILSHLDHSHPDPHVIHRTLSPFLPDPTPVVKSLFSHLSLPLCDDRRRRPRTESEERYRQHRRERRRDRRRRKEEYYRSRKRRHRDYDDHSPLPELDHPKRRRYRSISRDRDRDYERDHERDRSPLDRSPLDRSHDPSPDDRPFDRSPSGPIHDRLYGDRRLDRSPKKSTRDRSPKKSTRDRSPKKSTRDRSPKKRTRDRSPKKRTRDRSPKKRTRDRSPKNARDRSPKACARDRSPDRRVRNRSPREEHQSRDMSRRPWDNSTHTQDAASSPRTRNGPTSPLQEDGDRVDRPRGVLRISSPLGTHRERRKENGNVKRGHALADPGSALDSKAAPKNSNKLRHLRSRVLASLSKSAEDGAAENV